MANIGIPTAISSVACVFFQEAGQTVHHPLRRLEKNKIGCSSRICICSTVDRQLPKDPWILVSIHLVYISYVIA